MALAVDENPPELFLGEQEPAECTPDKAVDPRIFGTSPWAVACTSYQKEKTVARWMQERGIYYFLPLRRSQTPSSADKPTYLTVFPGIVFFQAHVLPPSPSYVTTPTETEGEVKSHRHVFRILKTGAQSRFKRDLAFLVSENRDNRTLSPEDALPDTPVRVITGSLRGYEGYIQEVRNASKTRLFVVLGVLQRYVSVEIDTDRLVKIAN